MFYLGKINFLQNRALQNPTWRPKALREANLEAQSFPKLPNWRSKALLRQKKGTPKPFRVVKNHGKTDVFHRFSVFCQSMGKLRWNMLSNWLRRPKSPSWTPTWSPKFTQGHHFGGPERSKDPNLEVQSVPKTPTWRSRALPGTEIGGPERSKNSTWESPAPKRAQVVAPKRFRVPNLEGQNVPRPQFGGSTRFQDADQSIRGTEPSDD